MKFEHTINNFSQQFNVKDKRDSIELLDEEVIDVFLFKMRTSNAIKKREDQLKSLKLFKHLLQEERLFLCYQEFLLSISC